MSGAMQHEAGGYQLHGLHMRSSANGTQKNETLHEVIRTCVGAAEYRRRQLTKVQNLVPVYSSASEQLCACPPPPQQLHARSSS